MSLEAAIQENTAVLKRVAALLEEGNKGRAEALAALPTSTKAAPAAGKATKGKGESEAKPAETKAPETKPAETKKGATTFEGIEKEFGGNINEQVIRDEFGGYLGVTDEKEREKRKANVKAILDELGGGKATELDNELRPVAIYWLRKFKNGETVDFKADDPRGDKGGEAGDDLL